MILTEKEAGKVICCGPPINFHEFHDAPFCAASGCMAWQWYETVPAKCAPKETAEVEKIGCSECKYEFTESPAASKPWTRLSNEAWICPACRTRQQDIIFFPEERRGYCGLAGKSDA